MAVAWSKSDPRPRDVVAVVRCSENVELVIVVMTAVPDDANPVVESTSPSQRTLLVRL